MQFLEPVSVT